MRMRCATSCDVLSQGQERHSNNSPMKKEASGGKSGTFRKRFAWWAAFVLPPILVFILLEVACVVLWRQQELNLIDASQTRANSYGKTSANEVQRLMNNMQAPVLATANFLILVPSYSIAEEFWSYFTLTLFQQSPFYQLDVEPNGTITLMSTPWLNQSRNGTLTVQQELAWQQRYFSLGSNRLDPNNRPSYWPSWQFDINTITLGQNGTLSVVGPWSSGPTQPTMISVRMSLFLYKLQSDIPPSPNTSCPASVCTTPDGRMFWGFISTSSLWSSILEGLSAVKSGGLYYTLSSGSTLLDSNSFVGADGLCANIFILNSVTWNLCYIQPGGWKPSWTWSLYLVFTIVCLAVR